MTGNNDEDKPAEERQYNPDRPNAERLAPIARRLRDIVRENDLTRPVTLAAAFPELSSHIGFLDSMDVVGYNYKEHLYEQGHAVFPDSFYGRDLIIWERLKSGRFTVPEQDFYRWLDSKKPVITAVRASGARSRCFIWRLFWQRTTLMRNSLLCLSVGIILRGVRFL